MDSRLCSQALGSQRAALGAGTLGAQVPRGTPLSLILYVGVLSEMGDRRAVSPQKLKNHLCWAPWAQHWAENIPNRAPAGGRILGLTGFRELGFSL